MYTPCNVCANFDLSNSFCSRGAVQLDYARGVDIRAGHGAGSGWFLETSGGNQRGHGHVVTSKSHSNLGETFQMVFLLVD